MPDGISVVACGGPAAVRFPSCQRKSPLNSLFASNPVTNLLHKMYHLWVAEGYYFLGIVWFRGYQNDPATEKE